MGRYVAWFPARLVAAAAGLAVLCVTAPSARAAGSDEPERIHVGASAVPEGAPSGEAFLSTRQFNYEQFRSRLEAHWFRRKALLERNMGPAAAEELSALEALCAEMGIERVPPLAAALTHEGDGFLGEGNFSKARDAYTAALRFSPGLAQAHAGLARAAWKSGDSMGGAVGHGAAALGSAMRESWYAFRTLGNGLLIALIAAGVAMTVFSSLLALRYQAALRHDVEEVVAPWFGPRAGVGAGWLVLLAPILTIILAPWTPVWWLALFSRHGRRAEMAVAGCLLGALILSGPAGIMALTACRIASDPAAKNLMDAAGHSSQPESILALEELSKANPADALYPSLLGDLYSRGRFLQEAMAQFTRAAELAPADPRPHNNIGNLYFQAGRHGEAATSYRTALGLSPKFLPAYVNLYLAEQKMFDFRQAEEALQKGREIDSNGIAALLENREGGGSATETAVSEVEPAEIWNRILARGPWSGGVGSLVGGGLRSLPSLAGLAGGVVLLLSFALLGNQPAVPCRHCGKPFCERCDGRAEEPDQCVQCRNLFARRSGVHAGVRRTKVDEIERWAAWRSRLSRMLSVLIPGGGDVFLGRTVRGSLLAGAWCLVLATIALHGRLLEAPVPEPWPWAILVPAAIAAVATWVVANRSPRAAE